MKRSPAILLIVAAVLAVFAPAALFEFVSWDDNQLITTNPYVVPPSLHGAIEAWQKPYQHLYIPLTYNVWAALASAGDPGASDTAPNPYLFHTANIALHLCSALLLYGIARRVIGSVWPAIACAIFWAIHPLQVEPVAWATGMKDVLSGCLAMLALYLYVWAATTTSPRRIRGLWYLLAAACLALASLAKPGVVTVPLVAIALDLGLLRRRWQTVLTCAAPMLVAAVPVALVTRLVQPTGGLQFCALWQRPLIAAHALATYLLKLLWPATLTIDYGLSPQSVLQGRWVYVAWLVPLAAVILAWAYRPLRRPLLVSLAIFILVLLPVLGLIPFVFQFFSTVADRYAYLALLGPALALGYVLARARYAVIGGSVLLLALAVRSMVQVQTWQDTQTLLEHTIAANPRSFLAQSNLGGELINRSAQLLAQGQDPQTVAAAHALAQEGEARLKKALEIWPQYPGALDALSVYYLKTGRIDEALDTRQKAADAYDRLPEALTTGSRIRVALAQACLRFGRRQQAIANLEVFLQRNPGDPEATRLLEKATAAPASVPTTRGS